MSNRIKIGADVTEIKKSIFDLSRTIDQNLTRRQSFKLFDDDTRKFIKSEAGKAMGVMSTQMENLSKEASNYKTQLERGNMSEKESLRIKKELIRVEKERASVQKDINKLEHSKQTMDGMVPGAKGAFGRGALGRGLGGAAFSGGLIGGMAGGIARMGPMGLLAGAGMAVGGYGMARAQQGFGQLQETLPERMTLRARGVRDVMGRGETLQSELGYKPQEVIRAQTQALEVFGTAGAQQDATEKRMRFSRFTGTDPQEMQQTFAGTQQVSGFKSADRTFEEFRAVILANKLEEAIGPYMQATNNLLSNINKDGLTLTSSAIQALSAIAGRGEVVSAQQAARIISSADQTVRHATGENAAFFMSAFSRVGLGQGTIGGTRAAMQTGLFGLDPKRMSDLQGAGFLSENDLSRYRDLGMMGDTDGVRLRSRGILEELEKGSAQFGGSQTDRGRFQQERMVQSAFNLGNVAEAGQLIGAMRKMQEEGATNEELEKARKAIEDLTESQDSKVLKVMAEQASALQDLGERATPAILTIRSTMTSIDKAIAHIASYFPGFTSENEQEIARRSLGQGLPGKNATAIMDKFTVEQELEKNEQAKIAARDRIKEMERFKGVGNFGVGDMSKITEPEKFKQDKENNLLVIDAIKSSNNLLAERLEQLILIERSKTQKRDLPLDKQ